MSDNDEDIIVKLHRAAADRYWHEKQRERALVEQAHAAAFEQQRAELERVGELINKLHRQAAADVKPVSPQPPETIHFTQLPDDPPDSPLHREWNTYRREIARLLAEGNEGRHILIKDEHIVGIW